MSTKTTTKRLALATVVALGAGVLSLVSVSSANAASTATLAFSTGTPNNLTATAAATAAGSTSVGVVGSSATNGQLGLTATMLSTGSIALSVLTPTLFGAVTVTGGTVSAVSAAAVNNATATLAVGTTTATAFGVVVKPNSGATSMTIQAYDNISAAANTSTSGGTLTSSLVVTVVSSSVAGTVSNANSAIYYSAVAGGQAQSGVTVDDVTNKVATNYLQGNTPWNQTQNAFIELNDAYGNAVTNSSLTGLLTATATNGALVGLSQNSAVSSPSLVGSAFNTATSTPGTWSLGVADPSAAPLTTTVTIAYNGVTVGTKTFVFTGPVAKVVIAKPAFINVTGKVTTALKGAGVTLFDSANNAIQAINGDPVYPTGSFSAASTNPANSGLAISQASGLTATYADWTCAANVAAHTDSVALKYTNKDGSVAVSNAANVSCAGAADTFKASFDKATYNPGDVAVLTVTFLDSKGNVAADNATNFNGYTTTAPQISVAGGTLAASVTTTDATTLGAATYRVLTGTTSGTFQTVVNITNSPDGTAQTVALNIGSSGTSLNDVLKGIVSLIASINKQIAALAKLVTKK